MNITPASTGSATYCPEDNKLRLYVGRVPRDEYEALRAEGWTSTPKQDCNFVAHWTPVRRDTALAYGEGFIGDEDQSPADRAADRAERFGDYRDRRTGEAVGHADRYDAAPTVHGYQSAARAERAATRHDRIADRAGDAWSKAEYWQTRTAGVISHALHVSAPGVRMGRIKELEAEIRKAEKAREEYVNRRKLWQTIAAYIEAEKQNRQAEVVAGSVSSWVEYTHPRTGKKSSLYSHVTDPIDPITGAEAAALYLAAHSEIGEESDWLTHYRLRLAYENQMMEAQGGRAAHVEMVVGGFLYGKQIHKVNKSPATGRVVSVAIKGPRVEGWCYKAENVPGTDYALHQHDTERLPPDAYRAPTEAELAAFEAEKKGRKAAAPKKPECPLVNPTDADADRLQALWNERNHAKGEARKLANKYGYNPELEGEPSTICRLTQAQYTANSGGTYSRAETVGLMAGAKRPSGYEWRSKTATGLICKIRVTSGENYKADRVIVITDKPQKSLPVAVWEEIAQAVTA